MELATLGERPVAQVARELGIAESGLRRWMGRTEVEEGRREGLTGAERRERWPSCAAGIGSWSWTDRATSSFR